MKLEDLKPGTYRLTAPVKAVHPDKRVRHDWRVSDNEVGALFKVKLTSFIGVPYLQLWRGQWSHQAVRADAAEYQALIAALEPIEDIPSIWMAREHSGCDVASVILDQLHADGELTLDAIKAAYERFSATLRDEE